MKCFNYISYWVFKINNNYNNINNILMIYIINILIIYNKLII